MATPPQRAYRAACPNCGAPVEFASAASASAVCSFCRSTLVRDGDALRRIGVSAELFDDHSPLQLGAAGRHQGVAFTLVGRLQMGYADGSWNEWHALFDSGKSGWLSEDNGAYVIGFDAATPGDAPRPEALAAGQRVFVDGRAWSVASVVRAKVLAAQGELPSPPQLEGEFAVADLRNEQSDVGTLDGSDAARVHWSVGRSVRLADLALQGLREISEKTLASRTLACPSCGAALEVRLSTTQSIACHQCHAVVDLSQGVGADLQHFVQNNTSEGGLQTQIPLGATGTLALGGPELPWQVVGFLERCDIPSSDEEEQTFWREYLLYHRSEGFTFLVDAEDGWSWVRPLTGTPQVRGDRANWQGTEYQKKYGYAAKVTWVAGEFYWRVRRDERAQVTDYHGIGGMATRRLSREQVGQEVTWSAGETMLAATVADAFGLPPSARAALERDVAPALGAAGGTKTSIIKAVIIMVVLFVLVSMLLAQCSGDRCDDLRNTFGASSAEYKQCVASRGSGGGRTSGGSYGGYSSGGGHK